MTTPQIVGSYRGRARWTWVPGLGWRLDFDPQLGIPPRSEMKADLEPPPDRGGREGWFAVECEFHAIPANTPPGGVSAGIIGWRRRRGGSG